MRVRGNDESLKVGENQFHWLALLRGRRWQRLAQVTRLHARQDRPAFRVSQIIGDPIDHRVSVPPEFIGRHVGDCSRFG